MTSKKITLRLSDNILNNFNIALALRHESQQSVLEKATLAYIQQTKEMQEQGLIKVFSNEE